MWKRVFDFRSTRTALSNTLFWVGYVPTHTSKNNDIYTNWRYLNNKMYLGTNILAITIAKKENPLIAHTTKIEIITIPI